MKAHVLELGNGQIHTILLQFAEVLLKAAVERQRLSEPERAIPSAHEVLGRNDVRGEDLFHRVVVAQVPEEATQRFLSSAAGARSLADSQRPGR